MALNFSNVKSLSITTTPRLALHRFTNLNTYQTSNRYNFLSTDVLLEQHRAYKITVNHIKDRDSAIGNTPVEGKEYCLFAWPVTGSYTSSSPLCRVYIKDGYLMANFSNSGSGEKPLYVLGSGNYLYGNSGLVFNITFLNDRVTLQFLIDGVQTAYESWDLYNINELGGLNLFAHDAGAIDFGTEMYLYGVEVRETDGNSASILIRNLVPASSATGNTAGQATSVNLDGVTTRLMGLYDTFDRKTFYQSGNTNYYSIQGRIGNSYDVLGYFYDDNGATTKGVSKILDANNNVMWGSQAAFPYRRLEYLQGTNIDHGFDTGTRPALNSYMKIDVENITNNGSGQWGRGAVYNNQRFAIGFGYPSDSYTYFGGLGSSWFTAATSYTSGRHVLGVQGPNAVKLGSGQGYSIDGTFTQTSYTVNNPGTWYSVYLFGSRGNTNDDSYAQGVLSAKMYYAEIGYDSSGINARFYPCQRKSDGQLGIMKIDGSGTATFLTPRGGETGTYTAGPTADEYWDLTVPS